MSELSGKILNDLWAVGAKHALYREDGTWYHQLYRFPGALFDANGYLVVATVDEYKNSPYFQIKEDLHVRNGISNVPGYCRVSENGSMIALSERLADNRSSKTSLRELKANYKLLLRMASEGGSPTDPLRIDKSVSRVIRDTGVSRNLKLFYDFKCQICGVSIHLGAGRLEYAEVHHIKPLGRPHNGPDSIENLICVCPNHHVQLDYGAIKLTKRDLFMQPPHEVGEKYIRYHNEVICKRR